MRRSAVLLLLVALPFALPVALPLGPATAQEPQQGEIYEPPRTQAGEAYRRNAKAKGIAVDARTLSADAPLDLRPPRRRIDLSGGEGTWRALAWVVLIGFGVLLAIGLLNARFGDLFRRDEERAKPKERVVELADVGAVDLSRTRASDLAAMDDPREALRLLLLLGLSRAADANGIALRRSFTARDVFARVPHTWRPRDVLEVLVRRAELVLFGGRPFGREDLVPLIEAAEPMLRGRR